MQYQLNQLAQTDGIEVSFTVDGEAEDLPAEMEVAIYRILQEALNNVRKHAHATRVDVSAQFTPREVKMTVFDNGKGFDVPESLTDFASDGSFGMMGLQERAMLFEGDIFVQSAPDQGTTVQLTMPRQTNLAEIDLRKSSTRPEIDGDKKSSNGR
jgi:signal transduction histidine kinase